MEDIKNKLTAKAAEINKILKELLDFDNPAAPILKESMHYTLFAGGKRIRPVLTVMTAQMLEGNIKTAQRVGAAIELIHTYSLIHDDLPSMDDDDYRRGELTSHKVYGEGIAVLTGDALLTHAFNIISKLDFDSDKLLKIINIISEGAGYKGMVGGQVLDLQGEESDLTLEELQTIHKSKTAALFKTSILAGAYCANPQPEEIKALEKFSYNLGILFQIIDDILDVIGDEDQLGKSTGRDQELNKSTYPEILGLEDSKKRAEKFADRIINIEEGKIVSD